MSGPVLTPQQQRAGQQPAKDNQPSWFDANGDATAPATSSATPTQGSSWFDDVDRIEDGRLSPEQDQQLKQSLDNRPTWRKLLGLGPGADDPKGQQVENQMMQSSQQSMTNSPFVKQQVETGIAGTGIIGAGLAATAIPEAAAARTIATVGPPAARLAGTAVKMATSPTGRFIIKSAISAGIGEAGLIQLAKILQKAGR